MKCKSISFPFFKFVNNIYIYLLFQIQWQLVLSVIFQIQYQSLDRFRHWTFPFDLLANSVLSFPTFYFHQCLPVLSFFINVLPVLSPQEANFHDKSSQRATQIYRKILLL